MVGQRRPARLSQPTPAGQPLPVDARIACEAPARRLHKGRPLELAWRRRFSVNLLTGGLRRRR